MQILSRLFGGLTNVYVYVASAPLNCGTFFFFWESTFMECLFLSLYSESVYVPKDEVSNNVSSMHSVA